MAYKKKIAKNSLSAEEKSEIKSGYKGGISAYRLSVMYKQKLKVISDLCKGLRPVTK